MLPRFNEIFIWRKASRSPTTTADVLQYLLLWPWSLFNKIQLPPLIQNTNTKNREPVLPSLVHIEHENMQLPQFSDWL